MQFVQDKMCVCVRTHARTHGGGKVEQTFGKKFFKKNKKKLLTMFFFGVKMSTSQADDLTELASKTEHRIFHTDKVA